MNLCLRPILARGMRSALFGAVPTLVLLLFAACGGSGPSSAEEAGVPEWQLDDYQEGDFLLLARIPAEIQAAESQRFLAPGTGRLHLLLEEFETDLEPDTLWAEFEPDQLALDWDLLHQREALHARKSESYRTIGKPTRRLELLEAEREARRKVAFYEELATSTYSPSTLAELVPETETSDLAELIKQSKEELEVARRELTMLAEDQSEEEIRLEEEALQIAQTRIRLEHRNERHRLRMPFAGRLTVNLQSDTPLEPDVYWVESGELLAVAQNLQSIEARLTMQDSIWQGIPVDQLRYTFLLPDGERITAVYDRKELGRDRPGERLAYYFRLPPEASPSAAAYAESTLMGELWRKLESSSHLLPKVALLRHFPDAFADGAWDKGVQRLWPDAVFTGEGQTQIGVRFATSE